jgi:hypothetical protein
MTKECLNDQGAFNKGDWDKAVQIIPLSSIPLSHSEQNTPGHAGFNQNTPFFPAFAIGEFR